MQRLIKIALLSLVLLNASLLLAQSRKKKDKNKPAATEAKADTAKAKKPTVAGKTKSSKKIPGLFVLYQDTVSGTLRLYVSKPQLGKDFIYQSFSMGGPPELFLNQNMIRENWLFTIRKAYDKISFFRQNTSFYYDPANAISKAANVDVSDAIFYSEKIEAEDADGYLIKVDDLFISEKLDPIKPFVPPSLPPGAVFNLGSLKSAKSYYTKIRSFPKNTDITVSLAYENASPVNFGGKDITDARYVQVKLQHSFIEAPDNNYKVRFDDPRVGYFSQEVDDMTAMQVPNYRDVIHRWYLVKKDPTATLSDPVEPITWWIENTTPVEIRSTIMEAGLKWNEAFEKAGFSNAVVMKQMPDTASWDPSDIRYNVIRWVSSDLGYAIGPSFVDPRTGQILGADITIDYSFLPGASFDEGLYESFNSQLDGDNYVNSYLAKHKFCSIGQGLRSVQASALTMAEAFDAAPEALSELKTQFLSFLILHEMGHTMGLNHNMKASNMLSPKEINNKEITRKLGMSGSVMDYPVVNFAGDKTKQGDYYTAKTGPYDWWAIEFGYSVFPADKEKEALNKILIRSNEPNLIFGNDADITLPGRGIDPRVMVWDMTNDMVTYSEERFKTVNNAMAHLKEKFIKEGRSYEDFRARYYTLNGQRVGMVRGLSTQIGGVYIDRSFPEQKSDNLPLTAVPASYQKSAMKVLAKYIFSPNAFDADKALYPYLQRQRRGFNFFSTTEDPKILSSVSGLQNIAFNFVLHPVTLSRSSNTTLYGNTYSNAEVMSDLVSACFNEDIRTSVNAFRQDLQSELVGRLIGIANATKDYEPAAKAAAYYSLKNIRSLLTSAAAGDIQTKAHRSNLVYQIDKGLSTSK